tara:strand:+ start:3848 stop:4516 length:669 start_codon:yes stop_codon:yes gene_type:complete
MIGRISGLFITDWQKSSKHYILIDCAGIGYEMQVLPKHLVSIKSPNKKVTQWTHQIQREDISILYGFETKQERDLFRELISINGVGPQIAMTLLEDLDINILIKSIINSEINILIRSQGVGRRTAERLSMELRQKLSNNDNVNFTINPDEFSLESINSEILETRDYLRNLEYTDHEINEAISVVLESKDKTSIPEESAKQEPNLLEVDLLKEALIWLTQKNS